MNWQTTAGAFQVRTLWWTVALVAGVPADAAPAELSAGRLVVVHNSFAPGAAEIVEAYVRVHPDLPAENILDLEDPSIAGLADVAYDLFVERIRDPIRRQVNMIYGLESEGPLCLLLIRGLPHRITDRTSPAVGDDPSAAALLFSVMGNASYASVDSELTLLWQDLEVGERGGRMDSYSDNAIANPYHTQTGGFDAFDRTASRTPKRLAPIQGVVWSHDGGGSEHLTAADLLLVSRLDGDSVSDVLAALERAQHLVINRGRAVAVLDENDIDLPAGGNKELDDDSLTRPPRQVPAHTGDDYERAADMLAAGGWIAVYDGTARFVSGRDLHRPVIAYLSYGENHGTDGSEDPPGDGLYVHDLLLAPGAIFNSIESFNGRSFNGLAPLFRQGQLAAFVAAGGTFGIGHVFEPFSFAVADNEILLESFLNRGLTWAEAAWSAIPVLSWQHVVLGDPLARVESVVWLPGDLDDDGDVDLADFAEFRRCFGARDLSWMDRCDGADLDRDGDVDLFDLAVLQRQFGSTGPRRP